MITKIRTLFSKIIQVEYKRIVENFISLSILNGLNYLFPLISLPYLVRVLGPEKYGTVAFSLIVMQYIILFTNYGFVISATKLVSIYKGNKERLSVIFSSVISIRLLFCLIMMVVLIAASFIFKRISTDLLLYAFGFLYVLGEALTPIWFFQGIQKMKFVTLINLISKGFFTILIFFVIRSVDDYSKVVLLQALGFLLASGFSIYLIIGRMGIHFKIPDLKFIKWILRDGWHVFLSTLSMNLYRNMNGFILGILTNDTLVGYYVAAEKIIKGLQGIASPLSESLFPYFSEKFRGKEDHLHFDKIIKIGKYYFVVLSLLVLVCFFSAPVVINLLLGKKYLVTVLNFRIMSMVIVFGAMNYLFGIVGLINMGYEKQFTRMVIISGIVSIILNFVTIPLFQDKGAAFCLVFSEFTLFVLLSVFIWKSRNKSVTLLRF
jgi:polysaccharide transporter, PST family